MSNIIMPRRRFLTGLVAAPAVVKASSLMPVKALPEFVDVEIDLSDLLNSITLRELARNGVTFDDLVRPGIFISYDERNEVVDITPIRQLLR
jgi:hypothetical protein